MGIYIKGMKMPMNCDDCHLDIDCPYDESQDGYKIIGGRPRNCPLVSVPAHGRLIDADALKVSLVFAEKTAEWAVPALRAVLMVIDEMPTIIPASEEGET